MFYVVVENTPGYMPENEPLDFEEYADAVAYLNERAAEYADDESGNYEVEYGWASGGNLEAVMVHDRSKSHDLGIYISVEIGEEES